MRIPRKRDLDADQHWSGDCKQQRNGEERRVEGNHSWDDACAEDHGIGDDVMFDQGLKQFIKPTPMGVPLTLRAKVEGDVGRKSRVICEVDAGDVLTAIGDSIFFRVNTEQLAAVAYSR